MEEGREAGVNHQHRIFIKLLNAPFTEALDDTEDQSEERSLVEFDISVVVMVQIDNHIDSFENMVKVDASVVRHYLQSNDNQFRHFVNILEIHDV